MLVMVGNCWPGGATAIPSTERLFVGAGSPVLLDAVGTCRQRCWRADWVIDLDIKAFFDSVPWDLILKAVEHHTDQRWILLYVRRWLTAPIQQPDGVLVERDRGTPQGSAISPLLANLFMHYAFDAWMVREFPSIPFERYCDDVVVHCGSERQARMMRDAIAARLESAVTRAKAREILHGGRTEDAFSKFDVLERRADFAEGRADALGMTGPKSLEEEIAELQASEKVDAELEAMKAALKRKGD